MVRVIFVETTRPVKMRPRIETSPVKGHFLSAAEVCFVEHARERILRTNVRTKDSLRRGLEAETNILEPPLFLRRDLVAAYIRSRP